MPNKAPGMWRSVKELTMDATKNGNVARWINHSCEANIQCGIRTPPLCSRVEGTGFEIGVYNVQGLSCSAHAFAAYVWCGLCITCGPSESGLSTSCDMRQTRSIGSSVNCIASCYGDGDRHFDVEPHVACPHRSFDVKLAHSPPIVALAAIKDIVVGEELSIDYNPSHADLDYFDHHKKNIDKVECLCGADSCRGWVF